MPNELASVTERVHALIGEIERGRAPSRARLEHTLTDGYAWALTLDAECARLERRISENAADLIRGDGEERARELSSLARRLARRQRDRDSLRRLLGVLRTGVAPTRVA